MNLRNMSDLFKGCRFPPLLQRRERLAEAASFDFFIPRTFGGELFLYLWALGTKVPAKQSD
jgi:hypothetical protein